MDRSDISTPNTINTVTTDASDDFLLLSDSPTYEDIQNIEDIEESIFEHKTNVTNDIQQKAQNVLITQPSIHHVATSLTTKQSIRENRCNFIYYTLIIFFITLYIYTFVLYISHYTDNLKLYGIEISYINLYNMASILLYLFLIILCLIFGYQYKTAKQLSRSNIITLNNILARFNKPTQGKFGKFILFLKFYKKIFASFEWTEFGVFSILTLMHYILTAFLVLSQSYNICNILTAIRYILNGFAIVLPAICLNLYHDHIRLYLFYSNDSISLQSPAPPDIPEDQQTEAGKISQTDDISGTLSTPKHFKNIQSILNDGIIQFAIAVMLIIFIITYQMLCAYNWRCYNHIYYAIYTDSGYFIINELILKLFVGILLTNTILHILSMNDYSYDTNHMISYGFITYIVKPEDILFIILMSFVEIKIMFDFSNSFQLIWNSIWITFYGLFIIAIFHIWYIISSYSNKIRNESSSSKANLRSIIDGIILIILSFIANIFLLLNDHTNWTNIRQISCNVFNVLQLLLIYTLKWTIEENRCHKFVNRNKTLRYIVNKLIIINIYNICYSLIFLVNYQNILENNYNIYYRLSFTFSFAIIQCLCYILSQFLCLYVQIFPVKTYKKGLGTGTPRGSFAVSYGYATGRRGSKQYKYRYSPKGYPSITSSHTAKFKKFQFP